MLTNEQFFKLPKWAQNEINRLRNNNEHLQNKLDQMFGNSETNTIIISGMDKKFLPNNSNIEFSLPFGKIEARIDKDVLHIYSSSFNKGKLVVMPHVSNVVNIGIIPSN